MADYNEIFAELRNILLPYAGKLETVIDRPGELSLDTRHIQKNKKPLWFGSVQIQKNYVSYHLMPVYLNPELLEGMSPGLQKRMQGKSCFHFTRPDPALLDELRALTEAGFRFYAGQGYV